MHPLVEVGLLGVDVPVEVDDAQVAVEVLGHPAHGGVADRVVAAEHHRERARGVDVTDRLGDLVERLLDVRRDGEDVAEVRDRDRLAQVDAELEGVRAVQRGDLADALRAEAGARAVRGAAVEGRAEHRHVVLAAAAHVLQVGRLEERVDAGEVRQLAAAERGDATVHDGVRAGQAELEAAGDLLVPLGGGQLRLALHGVARFGTVVVVRVGHGHLREEEPGWETVQPGLAVSRAFVPPWSARGAASRRARLRLSVQPRPRERAAEP
nr:hypothetical protein [Phytohabitans suffuscus]